MRSAFQVRWAEGDGNCTSSRWFRSLAKAKDKAEELSRSIGQVVIVEHREDEDEGKVTMHQAWRYENGDMTGEADKDGEVAEIDLPANMEDDDQPNEPAASEADNNATKVVNTNADDGPTPSATRKVSGMRKTATKSKPAANKTAAKKTEARKPARSTAATRQASKKSAVKPASKKPATKTAAKTTARKAVRTRTFIPKAGDPPLLQNMKFRAGTARYEILSRLIKAKGKAVSVDDLAVAAYKKANDDNRQKARLTVSQILHTANNVRKVKGFEIEKKIDKNGNMQFALKP